MTPIEIIHDHAGTITAVVVNGTRYSPEALTAMAAALEAAMSALAPLTDDEVTP